MHGQSRRSKSSRSRRFPVRAPLLAVLAGGVSLILLPAVSRPQSLPAGIRACAAESDADRRHACYDREVTRIQNAEKEASAHSPASRRGAGHASDRLTARIVSIDRAPDELVLHLDNGDVWQQTDTSSGGLGLRPGDAVTIERHLGSYWLSARHVSAMRVRKK